MSPTPEQEAIYSEIKTRTTNILVDAAAGSGKTTTIVHATTLLSPHVLTVFLAFNKRIAEELEKRVPSHIQVGTFHSRGFRALTRSLPKSPRINKDKVRDLLKKNLTWKDFVLYSPFVSKLVSLSKSAGIGTSLAPSEPSEFEKLIAHFSLSSESEDLDPARAIHLATLALEESNLDTKTIDFDDMLYLPLLLNTTFDKSSFLFIDEAQDTNSVQRALLPKMLGPSGRLISVGDPYQSIYGFRGADASAMDLLESSFPPTKRLPLSVSWRCSKAVVAEAQKWIK